MFDVFGSVKGLIKLDSVCIDNNVFRLHYKATFVILVVCSLLVTARCTMDPPQVFHNFFCKVLLSGLLLRNRQYIGDPIDCIVEEIPNHVMDTYCWIHSTFSVPSQEGDGIQGRLKGKIIITN